MPTTAVAPELIESFTGSHSFLSSNHPHPLTYRGRTAPTLAHHYWASAATTDRVREYIYDAPTASVAGRIAQMQTPPDGWEQHTRVQVMDELLHLKFQGRMLEQLLGTGTALLLSSNIAHDQFWGSCFCARHFSWPGRNRLGQALMQIRAEHQMLPAQPIFTRVALTGHRPKDLSEGDHRWVHDTLEWVIQRLVQDHGMRVGISGMAAGSDIMWAQMLQDAGVHLWTYLPCLGQADRWPAPERRKWLELRGVASREVVLGPSYDVRLLHARNQLMARDCDLLIAVHHESKQAGGLAATIRKAKQAGRTVLRLDLEQRRVALEEPGVAVAVEWGPSVL